MDSLLSKAPPRIHGVLCTALLTGMRRGEILGLRWENVDLERDLIHVLKTKSGHPRELPIPSKLREVLIDLGPKAEGPVFEADNVGEDGEPKPYPVINLRRDFTTALLNAKISKCRFHDLRHTFASHFVMATNDLPALQRLLGHASPAMTERYWALSRGHQASNVAAFESVVPVKRLALMQALRLTIARPEAVNALPAGLPA